MSGPTMRALCSGYGGLEIAVEAVTGARLVDHAEVNPHASRVHEAHWPGVPNLGDITAVDWAALEPTDILAAGFPCQPISQAGKRKVTNDARWLWPHIAHAVRVLRPRLVVLENVPPLLRPWRDDDGLWNPAPIEEVAADLAGCGYVGSWRCIPASAVGACHRRERVFIAATHVGSAGAGRDAQAVSREAGDGRRANGVVRPAVDARAGAAADTDGSHRHAGDVESGASSAPARGPRAAQSRGRDSAPANPHGQGQQRIGCASPSGRAESARPDGEAPADADGQRLQGGSERDAVAFRPGLAASRRNDADGLGDVAWGDYEAAIQRHELAVGRPAPCPVELGFPKANALGKFEDRWRLNPRFEEWMMMLPDGWVTAVPISRTAQMQALGNGVVPPQAIAALIDMGVHRLFPLEMGEAS